MRKVHSYLIPRLAKDAVHFHCYFLLLGMHLPICSMGIFYQYISSLTFWIQASISKWLWCFLEAASILSKLAIMIQLLSNRLGLGTFNSYQYFQCSEEAGGASPFVPGHPDRMMDVSSFKSLSYTLCSWAPTDFVLKPAHKWIHWCSLCLSTFSIK